MKMKKLMVTTSLASTLLFTGINMNQAKAMGTETNVNENNAIQIAKDVFTHYGNEPTLANYYGTYDKGDYYFIQTTNKSGMGVGGARVYKDGTVQYNSGIFGEQDQGEFSEVGKYEFAQQKENNKTVDNNANDENVTSTNAQENSNSQKQLETQSLPETGNDSTNSDIGVIIASVLLAMGSLLVFNHRKSYKE
ncbi:LPXTG cell wall anchor domain-containing protein [Staphylococcus devriesei]|uniref:LPXTG cell wall anchor domain-containing protein n=1 Tax=Staphylococcus devriesei TaxID=586733 RepID=UPI000E69E5B1|nr:LPXTG cell wall anchor domain-containing protein [Staphylococcus devriesei]RIL68960.1 LPXTG cell wall anchor domain-containing protein [Staphylococcus devriesei]